MVDGIILVFDEKYLNIWESHELVWKGHKLGELRKLRKKMRKSMNLLSYIRINRFIGFKLVWLICNKIMVMGERWIWERKKSENGHEWDKKCRENEREIVGIVKLSWYDLWVKKWFVEKEGKEVYNMWNIKLINISI